MSERDSNPSSDDTGNMTPKPRKTSENPDETTHSYFIPVVLLIVLSVTIVSTFYSEEFNSLFTATPSVQVDQLASESTPHSSAITQAPDNPENTAEPNANTENTPVTEISDEAATAAVEAAAADPALTTEDTPSSEETAEPVLNNELNNLVSMKDEAPYSDRNNRASYPYVPPGSYGMPQQHRPGYPEIIEQRRRLYEEAMQERREHRLKMREYRAEVLRRIERDRLDLYRRMQEIEQERQKRFDQRMNRMELVEKRSINHPI